MAKNKAPGLYLISPPAFNLEEFTNSLDEVLSGGNVAAFQLRLKNLETKEIAQATKIILPLCHKYGVPFIINDHVQIAREFAVDGIHLGEDDAKIKEIRKEFGKEFIIGASCYDSKHLLMKNAEEGASYLALGSFFPSNTKDTSKRASYELLKWCANYIKIPCMAIGGINLENIEFFKDSNVDFICVISAIWQNPLGATQAAKLFAEKMQNL